MDHHAKDLVPKIPSYLQDTPDFLRHLEDLKKSPLPKGSFPVSIDVVGLYGNIPHEEGIRCMEEALNTRADQTISTLFLISLLTQVLKFNVFEFDLKLYIQRIGTAMGTRLAPCFANIFMAMIDKMILALDTFNIHIAFYKRFIDDIFMIWTGTEEEFLQFMDKINTLHATIKFTCSYDLANRSTTFLDTTVTITDETISTDLYRKPTDRVQYLLPTSCHPTHTFKSIPYSLALRLLRIVSDPTQRKIRMEELRNMLVFVRSRTSGQCFKP